MTLNVGRARAPAPKRILIVEQYADTRRTLAKLLQYAHHHVTATDEADALKMPWGEPFDAVIVGVGRTAAPAVALLTRLRRRQQNLPAVALASCPWGSALDALICGGFTVLLPRPCPPDEILAAVERLPTPRGCVPREPDEATSGGAGVFSVSATSSADAQLRPESSGQRLAHQPATGNGTPTGRRLGTVISTRA